MRNAIQNASDSHSARDPGFDNIRCILIFCVVFGHILEICPPFSHSDLLYRVIYSFHMPAFLFLFGYFAKFRPERLLRQYVLPYIVFQVLYIQFANRFLNAALPIQFTTPYWLLWYLLACIYYQLLIPVYETDDSKQQILRFAIAFAIALLAGRDDSVGYYGSLSRFFAFQPWFLLGFYCRKNQVSIQTLYRKHTENWYLCCVPVIFLSLLYLKFSAFPNSVLYGSYSYAKLDYSALTRFLCMVTSLGWILFLYGLAIGPFNRSVPLLTAVGQNTMPVFLLHGFVIRLLPVRCPSILALPLSAFWIPALILLVFGYPLTGQLFQRILSAGRRRIMKE